MNKTFKTVDELREAVGDQVVGVLRVMIDGKGQEQLWVSYLVDDGEEEALVGNFITGLIIGGPFLPGDDAILRDGLLMKASIDVTKEEQDALRRVLLIGAGVSPQVADDLQAKGYLHEDNNRVGVRALTSRGLFLAMRQLQVREDTPSDPIERRLRIPEGLVRFIESEANKRGNDFTAMAREILFTWAESRGYSHASPKPDGSVALELLAATLGQLHPSIDSSTRKKMEEWLDAYAASVATPYAH